MSLFLKYLCFFYIFLKANDTLNLNYIKNVLEYNFSNAAYFDKLYAHFIVWSLISGITIETKEVRNHTMKNKNSNSNKWLTVISISFQTFRFWYVWCLFSLTCLNHSINNVFRMTSYIPMEFLPWNKGKKSLIGC